MQNTNQCLLKWALEVQKYNLDIHHIRESDYVIADTLSRNPVQKLHGHYGGLERKGGISQSLLPLVFVRAASNNRSPPQQHFTSKTTCDNQSPWSMLPMANQRGTSPVYISIAYQSCCLWRMHMLSLGVNTIIATRPRYHGLNSTCHTPSTTLPSSRIKHHCSKEICEQPTSRSGICLTFILRFYFGMISPQYGYFSST